MRFLKKIVEENILKDAEIFNEIEKNKKSGMEICLEEIKKIEEYCTEEEKQKIRDSVKRKNIEKGLNGEKSLYYEFDRCGIPIYILHDVQLKYRDMENQIDFLVFTPKICFVLECKNSYPKIMIDECGNFKYLKKDKNSGKMYYNKMDSPIEQNSRHMDIIRTIHMKELFGIKDFNLKKDFKEYYKPIVVWLNNTQQIDERKAAEHIKEQMVYKEHLLTYMKEAYEKSNVKEMKLEQLKKWVEFFQTMDEEGHIALERREKQRAIDIVTEVIGRNVSENSGEIDEKIQNYNKNEIREMLFEELKLYRESEYVENSLKKSRLAKTYRDNLLNEAMIRSIIYLLPNNKWKLEKIENISSYTIKHFGDDIIEIIDKYREYL